MFVCRCFYVNIFVLIVVLYSSFCVDVFMKTLLYYFYYDDGFVLIDLCLHFCVVFWHWCFCVYVFVLIFFCVCNFVLMVFVGSFVLIFSCSLLCEPSTSLFCERFMFSFFVHVDISLSWELVFVLIFLCLWFVYCSLLRWWFCVVFSCADDFVLKVVY